MARCRTSATSSRGSCKPLVAGGELHVGAPIPLPDVERWEAELHDASVESVAVDDARAAVLSTLVCRPPAFLLEADELALAAGLHNALFLVHPRAEQWSVSDRQRRKIIDTALAMVSQPLTRNRTRVMARHALLHNLFHLTRNDITVSWWTGRARFQGQKPPTRLTAWKGMRRVREEVTVVDFDELLAVPDTAPVIATLLRRTPLTQLLDSAPRGAAAALGGRGVPAARRRARARDRLSRSCPTRRRASRSRARRGSPPRSSRCSSARPTRRDVRAVAAFLVHLNALFCLGELGLREPGAKSPLISTGARRRGRGPAPARARDAVRAARRARARRSAARVAARDRRAPRARAALEGASRARPPSCSATP